MHHSYNHNAECVLHLLLFNLLYPILPFFHKLLGLDYFSEIFRFTRQPKLHLDF